MLQEIIGLRHTLHECAELSGQEVRTKALLREFLKEHTSLELRPCKARRHGIAYVRT